MLVTARKGIFGHGMGACGGWELTAQYLLRRREIPASGLSRSDLNSEIAKVHQHFVFDEPCAAPEGSRERCRWASAGSTPASSRGAGNR